jgi:hypothetical protein
VPQHAVGQGRCRESSHHGGPHRPRKTRLLASDAVPHSLCEEIAHDLDRLRELDFRFRLELPPLLELRPLLDPRFREELPLLRFCDEPRLRPDDPEDRLPERRFRVELEPPPEDPLDFGFCVFELSVSWISSKSA